VCLNYSYHIYQNLLNLPNHSNVIIKNVSWPHFSWATLNPITPRQALAQYEIHRLLMPSSRYCPCSNSLSHKSSSRSSWSAMFYNHVLCDINLCMYFIFVCFSMVCFRGVWVYPWVVSTGIPNPTHTRGYWSGTGIPGFTRKEHDFSRFWGRAGFCLNRALFRKNMRPSIHQYRSWVTNLPSYSTAFTITHCISSALYASCCNVGLHCYCYFSIVCLRPAILKPNCAWMNEWKVNLYSALKSLQMYAYSTALSREKN